MELLTRIISTTYLPAAVILTYTAILRIHEHYHNRRIRKRYEQLLKLNEQVYLLFGERGVYSLKQPKEIMYGWKKVTMKNYLEIDKAVDSLN